MTPHQESQPVTRRTALKVAGVAVAASLSDVASTSLIQAQEKPPMPSDELPGEELCFLSASEIAQKIRSRELSSEHVTSTILKRIEVLNPKLNAYCKGAIDDRGALKAAREIDQLVKTGNRKELDARPLLGIPVAIKDDLEVNGLPYTSGSKLNDKKEPPDYDDLAVKRLRDAGAVILGKTNLPEFGHKGTTDNLLFGTTCNPWDLEKSAGGSSGGNGAALAAGLAYLALGTDVGGSIRKPASFCGVVGLKPTFGRVPRVPAGNVFTVWVTGPMARSVADTALLLRVISGPDERDPYSLPEADTREWDVKQPLPRKLRVAWIPNLLGLPVDPVVARTAEAAVRLLVGAHDVVFVALKEPPWPDAPIDALRVLAGVGAMTEAEIRNEQDYREKRHLLSKSFQNVVEKALRVKREDLVGAQVKITEFIEKAAALFTAYDILTMPTVTIPAFSNKLLFGPDLVQGIKIDPHLGWGHTAPFNMTGHPAISIPCGWTADKKPLPIGLQIVGRRRADGLVLRVAAAVEHLLLRELPERKPPYA